MSSTRTFIRTHRVLVFFGLAYVLTWAPLPWGTFFNTGALIAALIVAAAADGVAGLKQIGVRLIRWRVNWIWYVLALSVPLLVNAATMGLTVATGGSAAENGVSAWAGVPLAIGITMINPLNGPLSEEPSFRGYALPILQNRRTPLRSGLLLAVLITIWHGPLFFIDQFHLRPYQAITTFAVTIWYVWLFDHAAGSVLITLLAHATEGSLNIEGLYPEGSADATRVAVINLLLWCAVALVLLAGYRRFWVSPAPQAARETDELTGSAAMTMRGVTP
ncbi:MAG: CPBP family intramembrane glutamic endopeptidase [Actinoplanes sp.]